MDKPKSSMSPERQEFIRMMQTINFGRINQLVIRNAEPVFDPQPVIIREHKFGSENGPRPEIGVADFLLKQQVVELFEFFDKLQDGVIDELQIKHGLPFFMSVEEVPA